MFNVIPMKNTKKGLKKHTKENDKKIKICHYEKSTKYKEMQ